MIRPKKLTIKDYRKIAKEEGLDEIFTQIYVKFMKKRFPSERHKPYAREWARRFKTGYPTRYMDNNSREIYYGILNKGKK